MLLLGFFPLLPLSPNLSKSILQAASAKIDEKGASPGTLEVYKGMVLSPLTTQETKTGNKM